MAKEKEEKKDVKEEKTSKEKEKVKEDETSEKEDEITKLKEEVNEYKDKYYRTLADLDNQRKQYDKEYTAILKYRSQDLFEKLIPSFEMFSMVIEAKDNLPSEVAGYIQGFDMIYRQMISALEAEGISEIITNVGDEFDHNIHAAMESIEVSDDNQVNKVLKVVRKGYKIHDRLIKPVSVVVGKKIEVKEEKNEEKKDESQANA